MSDFVRSTVVYRCLREMLGPALQAAGYRRVPKTQAAWSRDVASAELSITFRASSYGSAAAGGNTLDASVAVHGGPAGQWRRAELSRCLKRAELDEWRAVQAEVNARRPLTSATVQWLPEASAVGAAARAAYEPPDPARYREGGYVAFHFFAEEDVRAFAAFLARHAVSALERFAADRCPPPVLVPLPPRTFGGVPPAG